jgi:hypothetical protein
LILLEFGGVLVYVKVRLGFVLSIIKSVSEISVEIFPTESLAVNFILTVFELIEDVFQE